MHVYCRNFSLFYVISINQFLCIEIDDFNKVVLNKRQKYNDEIEPNIAQSLYI